MGSKGLITAILLMGLSQTALAGERTWNWIWVTPIPGPTSKSPWWTEQGTSTNTLAGNGFDIHVGGKSHLISDLHGTIRGKLVVATLTDLEADEIPIHYTGRLVTNPATDRISLSGSNGSAIVLYALASKSNLGTTESQGKFRK